METEKEMSEQKTKAKQNKSVKLEKGAKRGIILRALHRAKTLYGVADRPNTKVLVSEDLTYHVPIVYCYGDAGTLSDLKAVLFHKGPDKGNMAKGFEIFGHASSDIGDVSMCLVWISNSEPLKDTVAGMVHEIVHASQDILKHAGVSDSSGEAQAYLVERECQKVFREMYGMDLPDRSVVPSVEKALKIRAQEDEVEKDDNERDS